MSIMNKFLILLTIMPGCLAVACGGENAGNEDTGENSDTDADSDSDVAGTCEYDCLAHCTSWGGACDNGTCDELGQFHDGNLDQNDDGRGDDDHDTMTATYQDGSFAGFSCEDWTSTTATDGSTGDTGGGGFAGGGGMSRGGIMMGHSWPAMSGNGFVQAHSGQQCAVGTNFIQDGGEDSSTVGGGGGYGGIYCFAE